jgi:hypothetical protein
MGEEKKTITKVYQVSVSLNALQNIDEITGYIAFINQQPIYAIKVGDELFATIECHFRTMQVFFDILRLQKISKKTCVGSEKF